MPDAQLSDAIKSLGIPTVALIVVAWAVYKLAIWTANSVIVPLLNRHFKHLDEFESHMEQQRGLMNSLAENQKTITSNLTKLVDSKEFRNAVSGNTPPAQH